MNKVDDKKTIWAWALYDFANSAFTTLVVTFIYGTYFTSSIAPNEIEGTKWWSWAISVSAVFIAILSPILGALADSFGFRKKIMIFSTLLCVLATALLFFPVQGQVLMALTLFVIANICFELGTVFCNAYLPEIASPAKTGKVSGYAWGLGYFGGLIALVLCLFLFVQTENPLFGFDANNGENIRATNLLVALWFLIFSLPLFFVVKEKKSESGSLKSVVATVFGSLKNTISEIKKYQTVKQFLVARLVYNDALITVFAFGGIYAASTIGFTFNEIMMLGVVLNLLAGVGAVTFGLIDDKVGSEKVIKWSVLFLMIACVIAFLSPEIPVFLKSLYGTDAMPDWINSKNLFWLAAILIGLFSGPNQSSSRSLMARLTPAEKRNEFFGFYAFSGKSTSFIGPLLFGWATTFFETQQAGLVVVGMLFLLGYYLLNRIDV